MNVSTYIASCKGCGARFAYSGDLKRVGDAMRAAGWSMEGWDADTLCPRCTRGAPTETTTRGARASAQEV